MRRKSKQRKRPTIEEIGELMIQNIKYNVGEKWNNYSPEDRELWFVEEENIERHGRTEELRALLNKRWDEITPEEMEKWFESDDEREEDKLFGEG